MDFGCVQHNPENYKSKYFLHNALKQVSKRTLGLDLYEEGVQYLNSIGYEVVNGNAENFKLGEIFDVVTAGDIIEHLSNPGNFLDCAYVHLNDKGVIVISFPHPWHWRTMLKAFISYDTSPNREHTCWFCIATIKQLLSRHGFEVIEARGGMRKAKKLAWLDRLILLPSTLKNNSIFVAARKVQKTP